ncbi:ribonuclease Y [Candidatus Uhrbacteria bacterium]|nr:ribonuclease Y [Candidatus Uhrbacteria bacterium]
MSFFYPIIALAAGVAIGYIARKTIGARAVGSAESKAAELIEQAKMKQKELLLEAKDKSLEIVEAAKKEEQERRRDVNKLQEHLQKRESMFDQKLLEFDKQTKQLQSEREGLEKSKEEIKEIKKEQLAKLERVAGLSQEDAKKVLLDYTEAQAREDILHLVKKLEQETEDVYEAHAKNIIVGAIQRFAASQSVETTTTSVAIPSEEMKGRIIGREGRNIKSIEQMTGTEIIVDDMPLAITVSGFSSIRRQIAKRAIEMLVSDGRIHPGRIEETVEQAKKDLAIDIKKAGDEALYQLGITGVDPKLTQILGRLKYRTSYSQNVLQHSIEVGTLAAMMAEELGANVAECKKAGLFHDIGKAVDHEVQGTHPEIGYQIMKKFNFPEEIAYHCISHHEDHPKTIEQVIVKAADAISGARPGARKDTYEQYVRRLEELEGIATSFDGVEKCYAIQAGREIRVFVTPEKVDDLTAYKLAQGIARRIEGELNYPGEIKVTVIRETRVIEYAR